MCQDVPGTIIDAPLIRTQATGDDEEDDSEFDDSEFVDSKYDDELICQSK